MEGSRWPENSSGIFEMYFADLAPDELLLVAARADELRERFADRAGIGPIFGEIARIARYAAEHESSGPSGAHIWVDETAPRSHQLDDLGTVLAFAMQLVEDPAAPAAVRHAWNRIVESLAFELRFRSGTLMK